MSVYIPITNTIFKQPAKFTASSPSPVAYGGLRHPQRHRYLDFLTMMNKTTIPQFLLGDFENTLAWEGA